MNKEKIIESIITKVLENTSPVMVISEYDRVFLSFYNNHRWDYTGHIVFRTSDEIPHKEIYEQVLDLGYVVCCDSNPPPHTHCFHDPLSASFFDYFIFRGDDRAASLEILRNDFVLGIREW